MLVPNGLAYSSLAHVPCVHGLATCIFPPLVYAVLGSSKQLSIGPEAMSAMLVGHFSTQIHKNHGLPIYFPVAFLLTFMAGALLLLLGLLRLGFLQSVFSKPVLSGFVIAVGLSICTSQLDQATGVVPCVECPDTAFARFSYWWSSMCSGSLHVASTVSTMGSLLALEAVQRLRGRFRASSALAPAPLVVVLSTACSALLDLEGRFDVTHTSPWTPSRLPSRLPSRQFLAFRSAC